jgi:spore maturation protein CgeB
MRILLLWDYYPAYLRQFYLQNAGLETMPYADQNRLLLKDGFNWPAYLVPEFRKLGHQAEVVVGNADPAQAMWAREQDFCSGGDADSLGIRIVQEQIRRFRPDVLWFGVFGHYLGDFLRSIRDDCGAVVGWRASSGGERLDLSGVDCVLSSHAHFVDLFRKMGLRSEVMLPCTDPELVAHCSSPGGVRDRNVTFYGTLSTVMFINRLDLLSAVTRRLPCHIHSERLDWQRHPLPLGTFLSQFRYAPFMLRTKLEPAVFGQDLLKLLARSKIVLNSHVDSAAGLAGNIRMFEATSMGALLLTDACANVTQIFEPGKEIATYRSHSDAVEQIGHFLTHPEERDRIARLGQQRVLRDYNNSIKAKEALTIFSSLPC